MTAQSYIKLKHSVYSSVVYATKEYDDYYAAVSRDYEKDIKAKPKFFTGQLIQGISLGNNWIEGTIMEVNKQNDWVGGTFTYRIKTIDGQVSWIDEDRVQMKFRPQHEARFGEDDVSDQNSGIYKFQHEHYYREFHRSNHRSYIWWFYNEFDGQTGICRYLTVCDVIILGCTGSPDIEVWVNGIDFSKQTYKFNYVIQDVGINTPYAGYTATDFEEWLTKKQKEIYRTYNPKKLTA